MKRPGGILIFVLFFISSVFAENIISEESADLEYKTVYMELPYGETTLLSVFYCFDNLNTGEKILREKLNIPEAEKTYSLLKNSVQKKLSHLQPGTEFQKYRYALMKHNYELWIFENKDDGFLWGSGFYIK